MFDKSKLCEFLVEAKKAIYAAGDDADKIINEDKSTTMVFEQEDWKYHDNYFGGQPFGGRDVVFYKNKPVYIMTYYGQVDDCVADVKSIYAFLMNALKLIPEDKPYRGPDKYEKDNLCYINNYEGEVDNFYGEEVIKDNATEIYKARYIGGFVDQKR